MTSINMVAPHPEPTRDENFRRYLAHHLVEQHGAEPGLAPTVANILASSTTFDEDGKMVVRDRFGMPTDAGIEDIISEFRATPGGAAFFVKSPDIKPAEISKAPVRPQPTDVYGQPRRSADEVAGNRVRVGTAAGNPWAQGSINLTRQAMVQAADPALAAQLRQEAGR